MAESYADSTPSVGADTEPKSDKKPSGRLRKYWSEIEAYNKSAQEWVERGEKIVKIYTDESKTGSNSRRMALFWSNIETLKPAVYAKLPTVLCSRRYRDADPVGRTAAELLERSGNVTFDLYQADEVFRMVRDDRLLVGRGQGWVRYEADVEGSKVNYEKACIDYVHWCDFGHNVAGTWKDVWVVWRKVYKTRSEVKDRFPGFEKKLNFDSTPSYTDDKGGEGKAAIYEIWDKTRKKVCWISKECPDFLDDGPAPVDLRNFFPCPEPCYGTKSSGSLIPTPDYRYYQDQLKEIDDLTDKIASLTDFLVVRGFIPAGPSGDGPDAVRIMIQQLQDSLTSNKSVFVPVESWAGFVEKGGAKGIIEWMPVENIIVTLKGALEARQVLVQDVYQITGISDILRGNTDPDETLGAQQLKAQAGSRRIRTCKDDIARFSRDIAAIVCEIIAENFQPETIAAMTGFQYVPAPPLLPGTSAPGSVAPSAPGATPEMFTQEHLALLRNDHLRSFLIDIETDSTIQPDEDAEKQRRVEFITAMGNFMKQAGEIITMAPATAPMAKEMLLFTARGFRTGRMLEDVIERSMEAVKQQAMQPKPDPEAQKMQIEMQMKQQEFALDREKMGAELQFKEKELEIKVQELQLKLREMDAKLQMEQQKMAADIQLNERKLEGDMMLDSAKAEQDMAIKGEQSKQKMAMDADMHEEHKRQNAEMFGQKVQQANAGHIQKTRHAEAAHENEQRRKDAEVRLKMTHDAQIRDNEAADRKEERKRAGPKKYNVKANRSDGTSTEYEIH